MKHATAVTIVAGLLLAGLTACTPVADKQLGSDDRRTGGGDFASAPAADPVAADPVVPDADDPVVPDADDPAPADDPDTEETTPPNAGSYAVPSARNVKLTVKVTEKQCFGSAGCSVSYRVKATRTGGPHFDPDKTWLITYKLTGGEDGPVTGSFEVTGDKYDIDEGFVSTSSSGSRLTARITGVEQY